MEEIISGRHLQDAGFLGIQYTDSDLRDAFLTYWVANTGADTGRNRIVLRDGDLTFDTDSYLKNTCNFLFI